MCVYKYISAILISLAAHIKRSAAGADVIGLADPAPSTTMVRDNNRGISS